MLAAKKLKLAPPAFSLASNEWERAGEWFHHTKPTGTWMCQPAQMGTPSGDGKAPHHGTQFVYFHIPSGKIVTEGGAVSHGDEGEETTSGELEVNYDKNEQGHDMPDETRYHASNPYDAEGYEHESHSEGGSEQDVDLEYCIDAATAVIPGTHSSSTNICEDSHITRESVRLDMVAQTDALCYLSGMFDGHIGNQCSTYASRHLTTSLLAAYRQKMQLKLTRRVKGKKEIESNLDTLLAASSHAFATLDKNFLHMARRMELLDGSTACVCLIYGPHTDGTLKYITVNAGDSRAVLCRAGKAIPLTVDHKPDSETERTRIAAAGGVVRKTHGIARVMMKAVPKERKGSRKNAGNLALAVSRAFGDIWLKEPLPLVTSDPDVEVYDADMDSDEFMVLATDGVFDVLSNQEVVDCVRENLGQGAQKAATALVKKAEALESIDDKTATVLHFRWTRRQEDCQAPHDVLPPSVAEAPHPDADERLEPVKPTEKVETKEGSSEEKPATGTEDACVRSDIPQKNERLEANTVIAKGKSWIEAEQTTSGSLDSDEAVGLHICEAEELPAIAPAMIMSWERAASKITCFTPLLNTHDSDEKQGKQEATEDDEDIFT